MKRTWPFLFYLVYFSAAVFIQPNIIVYFQKLGFTGVQIGALAAMVPLIIMLGAPLWTAISDATNSHRLIMSVTILVSIITASLFPLVNSFMLMIPLIIIHALFVAPIMPFADSATVSMLAENKEMYGRVRMGGTIGWGLVALLAGQIIDRYGIRWAFWGFAAFMILNLFISQKFTYSKRPGPEPSAGNVPRFHLDSRWIIFLTLAFVAGIAFAVVNSYLFPYMEELNINNSVRYFAITISTIAELPVLFFSNTLLKRFTSNGLLVIAMAVTGLRLLLYAFLNFQAGILAFQFLNALTFPLFLVAGVSYANEISPEGFKSTAQGLFGSMVSGFGAAVGGFTGGLLLDSLGGQGLFLSAGIFVLASLVVILLLGRRQRAVLPKSIG